MRSPDTGALILSPRAGRRGGPAVRAGPIPGAQT